MATPLGSLVASMELDSGAFIRGLDRAAAAMRSQTAQMQRQSRQMQRAFQSVERSVGQLRAGITALIGTLAVRQFARFTEAAIQAGDAIAKQADRVGISTTELQRYRIIAGLAGISTEQLDRSVGDFARRLGDLRAGQGQLSTFLGRTNAGLRDQLAAAGSTSEAFEILVRRMANVGNAADRSALSVAGFGRAGGIAMTLFATALRDMTPEMEAFFNEVLSLPEKATRQAEKLNDTIFVMRTAFTTGFNAGIIEAFADALNVTLDDTRELGKLGLEVGRAVGSAMASMARAARFAAENIRALGAAMAAFVAFRAARLFLDLGVAITQAARAMLTLNAALIANPIGLAAAAIAAAVAALVLFHDRTITIGPVSFTMGEVVTRIWRNIAESIAGTIQVLSAVGEAMSALGRFDVDTISDAAAQAMAGVERVIRAHPVAGLMFEQAEESAIDFSAKLRSVATELRRTIGLAEDAGEGIAAGLSAARNPLIDLQRETRNLQAQLAQFRGGGFGALEAEQDIQAATAMVRQWAEANDIVIESFADLDAAAQAMLDDFAGALVRPTAALTSFRDDIAATHRAMLDAAEPIQLTLDTESAHAALDDLGLTIGRFIGYLGSVRPWLNIDTADATEAIEAVIAGAEVLAAARPIPLSLDTAPARDELDKMTVALDLFLADVADLGGRSRIDFDPEPALTSFNELIATLGRLQATATGGIIVTADVAPAMTAVERLREDLFALTAPTVEIDADLADAQEQFDRLATLVASLETSVGPIEAMVNLEEAFAQIAELGALLDRLREHAPTKPIVVVADTGPARASLVSVAAAHDDLLLGLRPIPITVESASAEADLLRFAATIEALPTEIQITATAHLGAALDEVARMEQARRETREQLARETGERRAQEQAFLGMRQQIQQQIEQQQLLLSFAGEESEEYRVQLRLLDLRTQFGAAAAAGLEEQVRWAESLTTALQEATQTAQARATIGEFDREIGGLIALAVAAEESAEAVREMEIALLAEATALQAGAAAGSAEAARIIEQVTARERLRDSIDATITARQQEERAAERRRQAAQDLGTELAALAAGPMGELIDRLEEIDAAAHTLPEAFEHEALVIGFLEAGEAAVRLGESIEDVALQLRLMGAAGVEAAERLELGVMAREWEALGSVAERSIATMLGNTARDFSTWKENLKRGLTEIGNQFGQLMSTALGGGPLGAIGGAVIGGLAANLVGSIGKLFGGGGGRPSEKTLTAGGGGGTFGISALTGIAGIGGSAGGGVQRQMAGAITSFDSQMAQILTGRQALTAFRRFQIENEGADLLIKRAREIVGSLIEGIDVNRVMAGVGRDVQAAQGRVGAVAQIAAFIDPLTPVARAAADQVAALTLEFRNAATLAERFGIGLDKIGEGFERAAAELRRSLLDPLEATLRRQADQLRGFFDGLLGPIEGLLGQLRVGPLSALSPQQQFMEAQAEFQRLSSQAQGGDLEAISKIASAGQVFLQQAQQFGASGPIFTDAFREVNSVLSGLQDELRRQREQETAGLPTAGDEMLNDTLARMRGDIQQTNRHLGEVQRELQRLSSVRAA